MTLNLYYEPQITLLSEPTFHNPAHLPGEFLGYSKPIERLSEYAGRVCYMSQHNPAGKTTEKYLRHILESGHGSVLEHGMFTLLLEGVSRSLTHELIRHRVGTAVSQLSQRYVDASETAFVVPPIIQNTGGLAMELWRAQCGLALTSYIALCDELEAQSDITDKTMRRKRVREAARSVLPNCTETKVVWSCNLRELRHILMLRGSEHADLEIGRLAGRLLLTLFPSAPNALQDLKFNAKGEIMSILGQEDEA